MRWLLAVLLCAAAVLPGLGAEGQPLTVKVQPEKARYVAGEPIGIVLTIANPGPQPVSFWFDFPNTFHRDMSPIQFAGGRSMPRLPPRYVAFSGPFFSMSTTIESGKTWSVMVFLQNFLSPPPRGTHRVAYEFGAGYHLGPLPEGEAFQALIEKRSDEDPKNDGPSLVAKGSITIDVGPPDPAALEGILEDYPKKYRREHRDEDDSESVNWSVIDAYDAVPDPIVIRHLATLLPPVDVPNPPGISYNPQRFYDSLVRFRDRKEAQRLMTEQLRSHDGGVRSRALEWLRDGRVAVPAEAIVALIDRELPKGHGADGELWYLLEAKTAATPELRERVARCLDADTEYSPLRALELLARWEVPSDPKIQRTLERVAGRLRQPSRYRSPYYELDVLAVWRYPLDVATLRSVLKSRSDDFFVLKSTLGYIRSVRLESYKELQPEVAPLLSRFDDEILLAALETLGTWGYRLTDAQAAHLLGQEGEVRKATMRYLDKSRPH